MHLLGALAFDVATGPSIADHLPGLPPAPLPLLVLETLYHEWLWPFVPLSFVGLAGVFAVRFRAESLARAGEYYATMLGLGGAAGAGALIAGVIYQPYYVIWMLVAAGVTWACPQTWDFTRRITPLKAAMLLGLFVVAVTVLATQEFNPFIYFIF